MSVSSLNTAIWILQIHIPKDSAYSGCGQPWLKTAKQQTINSAISHSNKLGISIKGFLPVCTRSLASPALSDAALDLGYLRTVQKQDDLLRRGEVLDVCGMIVLGYTISSNGNELMIRCRGQHEIQNSGLMPRPTDLKNMQMFIVTPTSRGAAKIRAYHQMLTKVMSSCCSPSLSSTDLI